MRLRDVWISPIVHVMSPTWHYMHDCVTKVDLLTISWLGDQKLTYWLDENTLTTCRRVDLILDYWLYVGKLIEHWLVDWMLTRGLCVDLETNIDSLIVCWFIETNMLCRCCWYGNLHWFYLLCYIISLDMTNVMLWSTQMAYKGHIVCDECSSSWNESRSSLIKS